MIQFVCNDIDELLENKCHVMEKIHQKNPPNSFYKMLLDSHEYDLYYIKMYVEHAFSEQCWDDIDSILDMAIIIHDDRCDHVCGFILQNRLDKFWYRWKSQKKSVPINPILHPLYKESLRLD